MVAGPFDTHRKSEKAKDQSGGSFSFRCGGRRWKVHALTRSQLDPVIGISVFIIDVYTNGKVDEEWLNGRNAKLCRGRVVLADNLVLAAAPLRCKPLVSAFRVRVEALERIKAAGEIGAGGSAALEDFEDARGNWIDLSATRPTPVASTDPPSAAPVIRDRDPTPPPLLIRDGIIYSNGVEEAGSRQATGEEERTTRFRELPLALGGERVIEITASGVCREREDTLRLDHRTFGFEDAVTARVSFVDDTQVLSWQELEVALGMHRLGAHTWRPG